MKTEITYGVAIERVAFKSFCRFVNRGWSTPRLTAKQAEGDDYCAAWQLWSYGNKVGWLIAFQFQLEDTFEITHDDRLHIGLRLYDDIDETIPPGEPDDPDPWHERRLMDWILSFAAGWVKHHYGADLVRVQDVDAPTPAPASITATLAGDNMG